MNESQLRDRLAAHAAATTTDRVAAWDRISAGRRRPSVARRLMPVGALALGVAAVVLAVNIAGDGSRVRATGPGAANLPNRPPAIEGSVYGLMSGADECKSGRKFEAGQIATYCLSRAAGRLDLPEKSLVQITAADNTTLLGVQFAREALWGWRASSRRAGVAIGPIVGSQVEPVAGLKGGVGQGSGFAVSDDGRIAWTSYRNVPSGGQRQELYVYDSKTGRTTTVFSSANTILGGLTFGPSGDIAVVEGRNWSRPALLVVAKDGSTRRLEFTKRIPESDGIELAPILGAPTVTWSATGLLAVSSAQVGGSYGHTYVIDAATGKLVRTIKNAHAQAWSPDGTGILVVRSKVGRNVRLSVAYGPGLAREKDLGPLPEAVTLRTWVAPASAAANLPSRPPAIEGSVYGLAPDRTGCGSRVCPAVHPITFDVTSRSMAPLGPDTQQGEPAGTENIQWQNGQLWVLGTRNGSPTGIGTLARGQLSMVIPSSDLANSQGAQEAHGAHNGSLAVSREGRIAWTGYRNEADGNQFREVYERSSPGGQTRVVYRSDQVHLGGLAYGPDGTLAIFELDMREGAKRDALMLLGPNGAKRRIPVPRDDAGLDDFFIAPTISWSNRGLLAVSAGWIGWGTDPTYIIDAATGKLVRTIKNAHAQAWSPDGTGILVVRSKTGRDGRLSVAYGPGLAKEKDLGPLPDALTLRTWVAP